MLLSGPPAAAGGGGGGHWGCPASSHITFKNVNAADDHVAAITNIT